MKKLYTTLLVSLFIFAAPQVKSNPLEPLSSKDRLDLIELGQPIHHIIFNAHFNQTDIINNNQSINDDDDELIPPYTCPACIINLVATYPIQQTKNCAISTCNNCCNFCVIPTCDVMCTFFNGHDCYAIAALAGNPLRATDDSCCGKCNTHLKKCDESCGKYMKKCDKSLGECIEKCGKCCCKSYKCCKYTLCCYWTEQHSNRNEE